ncbi:MAG: hypothetical protein JXR96_17370 [Deltaproteobacteria bacterium]|nr:hypothetical protein [Deltaproteobacteria bacterium]
MHAIEKLTGFLIAVALASSVTACSDKLECGAGTVERDGICEPLCGVGEVWDDAAGACREETACATGTVLVEGECVPLCSDGEVWDAEAGACREETACATGTVLVEGECVPEDDLCPEGQAWINGGCEDIVGCGDGTFLDPTGNECVPIDPMDAVDVEEGAEPNDLFFGGAPVGFDLPELDQTIILGGTIGEPSDLDGDDTLEPDFDTFAFEGVAGDRLRIEATAVGIPAVAYAVLFIDESDTVSYHRFGLPLGSRNAMRQVVLPFDGTYYIYVGDKANFLDWFGFYSPLGDYDGASDYTYWVGVTPIESPAPFEPQTADFSETGDLAELPQWRLGASTGAVIELGIEPNHMDVSGLYWLAGEDPDLSIGDFDRGFHVVPAGGLLVTADYYYALAYDTGFTIHSAEREVEDVTVDPSTPVVLENETVLPGGDSIYRFAASDDLVLDVEVESLSGAQLVLWLMDADMGRVFAWNASEVGVYPRNDVQMTVALEAGTYFLIVSDHSDPETPETLTYDLEMTTFELTVIDTGVLPVSEADLDIALTGVDALSAGGDEAFFSFEATKVGVLLVSAAPQDQLDIDLQVFDSFVLGVDGDLDPVVSSAENGIGAAETIEWIAAPTDVFICARASQVSGSSSQFDLRAEISFPEWLIEEVEPNDEISTATSMGTATTEQSRVGWGRLHPSEIGQVSDYWAFELAHPSDVVITTGQLGSLADTILTLYDEAGSELAYNDDLEYDFVYSRIEISLDPGTYYLEVGSFLGKAAEMYLVEMLVVAEYVCLPGQQYCAGNAVVLCPDGYEEIVLICAGACVDGDCEAIAENETGTGENDTPETGQGLGVISDDNRRVIEGEVLPMEHPDEDVDWYLFTLSEPSNVEIGTFQIGTETFDTEVFLYEVLSDGSTILIDSDDDGGPGLYSRIGPWQLTGGDYAIEVAYASFFSTRGEGGQYGLFINVFRPECRPSDPTTCNGSAHDYCLDYTEVEIECVADCAAGACTQVSEESLVTGDIADSAQVDRWGFEVGTGEAFMFRVVPEDGSDLDTRIFLCPADGSACAYTGDNLASDDDGAGSVASGEILTFSFAAEGEYYLAVEGMGSGAGAYELTVTSVIPCTPGEWYCDGSSVGLCDSQGFGAEMTLSCASGSCVSYAAGDGCMHVDETEPNNHAEGGVPPSQDLGTLSTGRLSIEGTIEEGDEDWFQITLSADSVLTISTAKPLAGEDTQFDSEIEIWDPSDVSSTLPISADSGYLFRHDGVPYDVLERIWLPAGTYLLLHSYWSDSSTASGDYRLEIDLLYETVCPPGGGVCSADDYHVCDSEGLGFTDTYVCVTGACQAYGSTNACGHATESEPNDSWDSASDLGTLSGMAIAAAEGYIDSATAQDSDWFWFTLAADSDVSIETMASLIGSDPLGDTEIWLYEPDGGLGVLEIANDDDGGESLYSLIQTTLAAGEYWVKVEYYTPTILQSGDYRLVISSDPP